MSRKAAVAGIAVLIAGATAAALSQRPGTPAIAASAVGATAEITRSDLVDTKAVGGTLGYSGRLVQPKRRWAP
ncbi:hypothetical protein [Nonomuraea sp. NPDC049141]|uniref:hypothetical protein n=1 Tax=Nonomuraea sp. NPDC049141 TaxID=3155500 RepID=UPI0033C1C158